MIAVAMVAALIVVTAAGAQVGAAVVARHRGQAAADLAALAGAAQVASGPETACARAAALARTMGTVAVTCAVVGLDVVLSVEASTGLRLMGTSSARAVARAGPADSPG